MIDVASITSGLTLCADGIWYGQDRENVSYPAGGNEVCAAIEDDSFWFTHRNECISAAVTRFPPEAGGTIFDVGGGNGFVSLGLMRAGFDVAVIEPGASGAASAKRRGIPTVICATAETAGMRSHSLAAVGLFDVIEHVENDVAFLGTMRSWLKPGGCLYATVPAYELLWSKEDEQAGHFRRYNRKSICRCIVSAGFEVAYASYLFRPLPLPILLFRTIPYRLGASSAVDAERRLRAHAVHRGLTSRILNWALAGEIANIQNARSMRFGGSCLVVARAV